MWLTTCSRQSCSKNSLHTRSVRYTRKTYLKAYYQRCRLLVMDFWWRPLLMSSTRNKTCNRLRLLVSCILTELLRYCGSWYIEFNRRNDRCSWLWELRRSKNNAASSSVTIQSFSLDIVQQRRKRNTRVWDALFDPFSEYLPGNCTIQQWPRGVGRYLLPSLNIERSQGA